MSSNKSSEKQAITQEHSSGKEWKNLSNIKISKRRRERKVSRNKAAILIWPSSPPDPTPSESPHDNLNPITHKS